MSDEQQQPRRHSITLKLFLAGLVVGFILAGFGSPNGLWIGAFVGAIMGLFFGLIIEAGNAATRRLRGKPRSKPPNSPVDLN